MDSKTFARKIFNGTPPNYRTGQHLFNSLPVGAQNALVGTSIDPFHRDFVKDKIERWADNHLIFDGEEIICLFGLYDNILWEKS